MKIKVTAKGQITIPKPLRDQLGLTSGVVLDFTSDNGRLVVVKEADRDPIAEWRGKGRLPTANGALEYLKAIRDDHRAG